MKFSKVTLLSTALFVPAVLGGNSISTADGAGVAFKLARAVDALQEALTPDIDSIRADPACHYTGQACDVAKRDAVELLGRVADAYVEADGEGAANAASNTPEGWCEQPGNPCNIARSQNQAAIDGLNGKEVGDQTIAKRDEASDEDDAKLLNCHRTDGGPCLQARFDLAANNGLSTALEAHGTEHGPGSFSKSRRLAARWGAVGHNCGRHGQVCMKVKRAQDIIMDLTAETNYDEAYDGANTPATKAALAKLRRSVIEMRQDS